MKYRIICTGNPETSHTLAHTVRKYFPDTKFIHKSNGYDLLTEEGLKLFQDEVINYDVFLNCSYIEPGLQETLLKIARTEWYTHRKENEIIGYVFNIGSISEFIAEFHDEPLTNFFKPEYTNSKISLKKFSAMVGTYQFKTTYIILGGFRDIADDNDPRLDPNRILEVIKWILDSTEFTVPVIGLVGPQRKFFSLY